MIVAGNKSTKKRSLDPFKFERPIHWCVFSSQPASAPDASADLVALPSSRAIECVGTIPPYRTSSEFLNLPIPYIALPKASPVKTGTAMPACGLPATAYPFHGPACVPLGSSRPAYAAVGGLGCPLAAHIQSPFPGLYFRVPGEFRGIGLEAADRAEGEVPAVPTQQPGSMVGVS